MTSYGSFKHETPRKLVSDHKTVYLNFHLISSTSLCTKLRSKKCPRCFPEICPTQKASASVQTSADRYRLYGNQAIQFTYSNLYFFHTLATCFVIKDHSPRSRSSKCAGWKRRNLQSD